MYDISKLNCCFKRIKQKLPILIVVLILGLILMLFGQYDKWSFTSRRNEELDTLFSDILDMKEIELDKMLYDDASYHENQVMLSTVHETTTYSSNEEEIFSNILHYQPTNAGIMPKLNFIPRLKSPCFYVNNSSNAASKAPFNIRCLPRIFILGFPKCGTTDLHFRLIQHQHLYPGVNKEPLFWSSMYRKNESSFEHYTCMYAYGADFVNNYCGLGTPQEEMSRHYPERKPKNCVYPKKCFLKSPQWSYCRAYVDWEYRHRKYNNSILKLNVTLQRISSIQHMHGLCHEISFIDSSPNTMWFAKSHTTQKSQSHLEIPLAIQALIPNARYLVIMRNPVNRLWSDFMYFSQDLSKAADKSTAPEIFHEIVINSIAWWKNCTEVFQLPLIQCAYGMSYPQNLSQPNGLSEKREAGKLGMWSIRAADRLRIGIYYLYIKEWLKVIPRDQFYFIKFEHYVENPLKNFEHGIYDFLELGLLEHGGRNTLIWWQVQGQAFNKKRKTKNKVNMLDATKTLLENFYRPYNAKLAELLKDQHYKWF